MHEKICRQNTTKKLSPKVLRNIVWEYILPDKGISIKVCRGIIQALFQISTKRIRVIQSKRSEEFSFEETHTNRPQVKI